MSKSIYVSPTTIQIIMGGLNITMLTVSGDFTENPAIPMRWLHTAIDDISGHPGPARR